MDNANETPNLQPRPERNHLSALYADQEEIDVRFGYIAEDLRLDKVEAGVLGVPSYHLLKKMGAAVINYFCEGMDSRFKIFYGKR